MLEYIHHKVVHVVQLRSRFERTSTQSNICDIEGGTIAIYSTAKLAAKGFAEALGAGMVERVSVVYIQEIMRDDDFPGLLEPWRY